MDLRPRSDSIDYSDDKHSELSALQSIKSTSKWDDNDVKRLKIKVVNVHSYKNQHIFEEAQQLVIPEWNDGHWLLEIRVEKLEYNNKIKTFILKLRRIYMASLIRQNLTEDHIDGFMDSLLHILRFDDYPCSVYPQYKYSAKVNNKNIAAKPDFSILSNFNENKIVLVIENKTSNSASITNNWMEPQILGELFVAVHNVVTSLNINYPVSIYAVRVIETRFTFYKTVTSLEYIIETAQTGWATNNEMIVERYPQVSKGKLAAYDICDSSERLYILQCMCYIRDDIVKKF